MEYEMKTYLEDSSRTLTDNFFFETTSSKRELHAAIGITTEAGELLLALTKNKIDVTNVHEELGDINWYAAIIQRERNFVFDYNHVYFGSNTYFETLKDAAIYISVQSSEFLNLYKRQGFYDRAPAEKDVVEYTVNILLACKFIYNKIGVNPYQSLSLNIDKLKIRYPEKFDSDLAINRDLNSENKALNI